MASAARMSEGRPVTETREASAISETDAGGRVAASSSRSRAAQGSWLAELDMETERLAEPASPPELELTLLATAGSGTVHRRVPTAASRILRPSKLQKRSYSAAPRCKRAFCDVPIFG